MKDITKMFLSGVQLQQKEALLEINDEVLGKEITILAKGENNLLTGEPGQGKSLITTHFISQFLLKPCDWFLTEIEEIAVVLIDTEQGEGQIIDWYIKLVYQENKDEKIKLFETFKRYKIFSIKDDDNKLEAFKNCINECKEIFPKKHLFIIIDNLTSFVKNVLESSNETLEKINIYRENNTLLSILHENHKTGSNHDPTGHIGSQAQRNAAIHWNIKKDKDNSNNYIMSCKKSRFQDLKSIPNILFSLSQKNDILYFENCELNDQSNIMKRESTLEKVYNETKILCDSFDIDDNRRLRKNIVKQLEETIGIKDKQLYRHITTLIKEGKLMINNKEYLDYLPF